MRLQNIPVPSTLKESIKQLRSDTERYLSMDVEPSYKAAEIEEPRIVHFLIRGQGRRIPGRNWQLLHRIFFSVKFAKSVLDVTSIPITGWTVAALFHNLARFIEKRCDAQKDRFPYFDIVYPFYSEMMQRIASDHNLLNAVTDQNFQHYKSEHFMVGVQNARYTLFHHIVELGLPIQTFDNFWKKIVRQFNGTELARRQFKQTLLCAQSKQGVNAAHLASVTGNIPLYLHIKSLGLGIEKVPLCQLDSTSYFRKYWSELEQKKAEGVRSDVTDTALVELGRALAEGGFSVVLLGRHQQHGQVAVKFVYTKSRPEPNCLSADEIFRREVAIHERLAHPNILKMFGYIYTGKMTAAIILEYMANGALDAYLRDPKTTLSAGEKRQIAKEITSAVAYLHRCGIGHFDIKSCNTLLNKDKHAKLADFGTAASFDDGQWSRPTIHWCPPECFGIELGLTVFLDQIDSYSLAMTMFEMVKEAYPWGAGRSADFIENMVSQGHRPIAPLPELGILRLIQKGWTQDPENRSTIFEMETALLEDESLSYEIRSAGH